MVPPPFPSPSLITGGGKGDLLPDLILPAGILCAALFHQILYQWSPQLQSSGNKGKNPGSGPPLTSQRPTPLPNGLPSQPSRPWGLRFPSRPLLFPAPRDLFSRLFKCLSIRGEANQQNQTAPRHKAFSVRARVRVCTRAQREGNGYRVKRRWLAGPAVGGKTCLPLSAFANDPFSLPPPMQKQGA